MEARRRDPAARPRLELSPRMRLDSFSMVLETNRDKKESFLKIFFVFSFHTARVNARCSKYDFWNPGNFLDRNR